MVNQEHSEFGTQQTALVPAPLFPLLHVAEQKIVVNPKLTIVLPGTLGICSPSQTDQALMKPDVRTFGSYRDECCSSNGGTPEPE